MPQQFHPRKRGAHRVACIALYRALLSHCSQIEVPLPFAHARIHPVASIIRKQFRRNAGIESPTLVVTALKMGYEAEELLQSAATGSAAAKSKILALVADVQAQGAAARHAAALNPSPPPPPPRRPRPAPYPGAADTVSVRPCPSAEIKRDVRRLPVLVGANGYPFIRVKKPQPEYLNRVLRDKIERKAVRHERIIQWSGEQMDLAAAEQEWDERLGVRPQPGEGNWQRVLVQETQRVGAQMQSESERTGELGRKMTEVVDRERAVWEEERTAAKREKERVRRKKWRRKRREMKEAAEGFEDQLSP